MAFTGTLLEIRTLFRQLTGLLTTGAMSDNDANDRINDFYQNVFPLEVDVDDFRAWLTQLIEPTDSGEYDVSANVLKLLEPVTISGDEVELYQDPGQFFGIYPKDTGSAFVISDAGAGLAIGTSSKSAVKNGNLFYYDVAGNSYVETVDTETELSGGTVPQNLYGAWRLEIDADGTVTIVEAADNATGYTTPGQAVQGIEVEKSTAAAMGYVTALSTDAGGFIPGTTDLDDAAVTATFTDGFNSTRNTPIAVLLFMTKLFARPKSDDWGEIKAPYIKKPIALSGDASVVADVRWWQAIAYGTAIVELSSRGDVEKAVKLQIVFDSFKSQINNKFSRQKGVNRVAQPSW